MVSLHPRLNRQPRIICLVAMVLIMESRRWRQLPDCPLAFGKKEGEAKV
jgi:hypothetical protein